MKRYLSIFLVATAALGLFGCEQRTDKVDAGGVILSVSEFDGLPLQVSVSSGSLVVGEIVIESIAKNESQPTSPLMNVEMQRVETTFTRADTGTILPPPYVAAIFGVTPIGGDQTYENLPLMGPDQFLSRPLSDLLLQNGGFDKETGQEYVRLNVIVRFFGQTLSGDSVETEPISFTVTFTR